MSHRRLMHGHRCGWKQRREGSEENRSKSRAVQARQMASTGDEQATVQTVRLIGWGRGAHSHSHHHRSAAAGPSHSHHHTSAAAGPSPLAAARRHPARRGCRRTCTPRWHTGPARELCWAGLSRRGRRSAGSRTRVVGHQSRFCIAMTGTHMSSACTSRCWRMRRTRHPSDSSQHDRALSELRSILPGRSGRRQASSHSQSSMNCNPPMRALCV